MKKKRDNKLLYRIYSIIFFFVCLEKINSQSDNNESSPKYEIHLKFNSIGLHSLYCDDNINLFGTENINFYQIKENGLKININSLVIKESNQECEDSIKFNINSINEIFIIEFLKSPKTLRQLFQGATIGRIERFDYPFPENNNDFRDIFYHCIELTYVDFTKFSFSTAIEVSSMFYDNKKLETVIFPENEQANNIEDFSDMFAYCSQLTSIDLSYFNLKKTRNMGYMFRNCYYLKSIIFSNSDKAENIKILSSTFEGCKNLTSIDLSNFSFLKVTNMADMFKSCSNIKSIIFPTNEKSTSIQYIKNIFYGCGKLTSIDLSGLTFTKTNDISSLFEGCSNLETIALPKDEKANGIENFNKMFYGCSKLTSIDLSNISFVNAKKLNYIFNGCVNLKTLIFPTGEKATKVESYERMFLNCINLISLDLTTFSFINSKSLNLMFFNCSNLETLILPKDEIATNIEDLSYMFGVCFKLKSIDMSGISLKNVKNMMYTFFGCIDLETITFANDDEINNIEKISYAFANCHKLKSINLSNFNLEKVTDLSFLFYSCFSLETLILPYEKVNNVNSYTYMFYNCTSLKNIDLFNISLAKANNIDFMFTNCTNLLTIKLNKYEEIKNIKNMNKNFENCTSLTSINLSNIYINDENANLTNLFFNCISLKEVFLFNLNSKQSISTINYFGNVNSLEGCLFYTYDNIHLGNSITIKECSKYMGFQKCGNCINSNYNEYCTLNFNGKHFNFYYLDFEINLPNSEKQCYWSENFENVNGYTFMNNSNKNKISYYVDYCDNYCEKCSEDRLGCTQCKNNLFPIDIEYNDYINNIKSFFLCYDINDMSNYFFDIKKDPHQFIKCIENCTECIKSHEICSKCNYDKKYYKIENQEGLCYKNKPGDNWALHKDAFEWRICNERCATCDIQSKSDIDHHCYNCSDNYYSYDIDYYNLENHNIKTLNCWLPEEVKKENRNYYLNPLTSRYEKCDDSCAECEIKSNNCLECQMNHYYINGYKNGTCFHYPLEKYSLGLVNGTTVYLPCFYLCKFCNQVSPSFLYQQCSQCDEIDYVLDPYSLNQSYCIPKDKSNSLFLKEKTLWYIDIPQKFEEQLTVINKNMKIDYQRTLLKDIFANINYTIVDKCPPEKPFIINSTRQCVSSCNSSNLIEFGIFMTKTLYFYNNICYDECPAGSIKDEDNFICKEINEYITINETISKILFKNNYIEIIKNYSATYANQTLGISRTNELSNYFYNLTNDIHNNSLHVFNEKYLKQIRMPIFDFSECLPKLREAYKLSDSEDIFVGIIEYNDDIDSHGDKNNNIINSTNFTFFYLNGTNPIILDCSYCNDIKIIVEKYVNIQNSSYELINFIKETYGINIFSKKEEFFDICLIIKDQNNELLTLEKRKDLIKLNKIPCDDGCDFIYFYNNTNYSKCLCPINTKKDDPDLGELISQITGIEVFEYIIEMFKAGNLKYFSCINNRTNLKFKSSNVIWYPSLIFIIIDSVFLLIFFIFNYNEIKMKFIETIQNDKTNKLLENEEDKENRLEKNFEKSRKLKENCIKIFLKYLKHNLDIIVLFCYKKNNILQPICINIILLFMFLHIYYFITVLAHSDKYITPINSFSEEFEYIIKKEINRTLIVFIISIFIYKFFVFIFFRTEKKLNKIKDDKEKNIITFKRFKEEINSLKKCFRIKLIIYTILINILNIVFLLFIYLYGNITEKSSTIIYVYLIIGVIEYILLKILKSILFSFLKWISIKFDIKCLFDIIKKIF